MERLNLAPESLAYDRAISLHNERGGERFSTTKGLIWGGVSLVLASALGLKSSALKAGVLGFLAGGFFGRKKN